VFSDAHADYVAAAYAAPEDPGNPYAYRACDIADTPARPGDLVCHTRGRAAAVADFAALREALAGSHGMPMHCDLVVAADAQGIDAVGGNVLQSVTRRRLETDTDGVLHPSYRSRCAAGPCAQRHLSAQPWVVLLQWRR
jgi:hypothetical protein